MQGPPQSSKSAPMTTVMLFDLWQVQLASNEDLSLVVKAISQGSDAISFLRCGRWPPSCPSKMGTGLAPLLSNLLEMSGLRVDRANIIAAVSFSFQTAQVWDQASIPVYGHQQKNISTRIFHGRCLLTLLRKRYEDASKLTASLALSTNFETDSGLGLSTCEGNIAKKVSKSLAYNRKIEKEMLYLALTYSRPTLWKEENRANWWAEHQHTLTTYRTSPCSTAMWNQYNASGRIFRSSELSDKTILGHERLWKEMLLPYRSIFS